MPKTAELSESTRMSIIQLHKDGLRYRKVSYVLNIPISTVDDTVRRWKSFDFSTSLPRSGRPTKISDRMARNLVRKKHKNPRLTRSELQKDLQMQSSGTNECNYTIRTVLRMKGVHSRTPRKFQVL